jgi:hypothetical protein
MRTVQVLLTLAVVLVAGSLFLAIAAVYGAGFEGIVGALRGLALALACLLGAGLLHGLRGPPRSRPPGRFR